MPIGLDVTGTHVLHHRAPKIADVEAVHVAHDEAFAIRASDAARLCDFALEESGNGSNARERTTEDDRDHRHGVSGRDALHGLPIEESVADPGANAGAENAKGCYFRHRFVLDAMDAVEVFPIDGVIVGPVAFPGVVLSDHGQPGSF